MFTSRAVGYEIGAQPDVMSYGGIGAVHRLTTKLGLVEAINERVDLLKVHLPYHESDHVLNIAYNVLCGGTRLEDIKRLRRDVAYMNALGTELIPDATTAGDFLRRFKEVDVVALMEAINTVRPQLWSGRGQDLLGSVAYLDVDGTIVPTCGEQKAGMDLSYKGIWGYAPLLVTLANTREVLYIVNRAGNAASQSGAAEWIDKAIDLVEPHAERICVRGDTAFSLTAHFDHWAQRVDFIFGMSAHPKLVGRAETLDESCWKPLERRPRYTTQSGKTRERHQANEKQRIVGERGYVNLRLDHEDVAEFTYRPHRCGRSYRVVIVRKNITKMKGQTALLDEIRYLFYITTRTDLSATEVVSCANERCDQENIIEQLKNGVGALRVPFGHLLSINL